VGKKKLKVVPNKLKNLPQGKVKVKTLERDKITNKKNKKKKTNNHTGTAKSGLVGGRWGGGKREKKCWTKE